VDVFFHARAHRFAQRCGIKLFEADDIGRKHVAGCEFVLRVTIKMIYSLCTPNSQPRPISDDSIIFILLLLLPLPALANANVKSALASAERGDWRGAMRSAEASGNRPLITLMHWRYALEPGSGASFETYQNSSP
jgi:hypothetical protein